MNTSFLSVFRKQFNQKPPPALNYHIQKSRKPKSLIGLRQKNTDLVVSRQQSKQQERNHKYQIIVLVVKLFEIVL